MLMRLCAIGEEFVEQSFMTALVKEWPEGLSKEHRYYGLGRFAIGDQDWGDWHIIGMLDNSEE